VNVLYNAVVDSVVLVGQVRKWPIVFAGENHELWNYFEVRALPQYFIVDDDRKIIATTVTDLEGELEMLKQ
jgi:hypothetical protein